jgi:diadenylate cyclase
MTQILGVNFALALLDISLLSILIYRLLLLIRGTRAVQMFLGLLTIIVLSIAADWLALGGLNWLISNLKTVWVVGFLILFQPELRRGLAQIGRSRLFARFLHGTRFAVLGEVVKAVEEMAEERVGALIVLERNDGLRNYVETGTLLDAAVTSELLSTIFTPHTTLHDGAVIVRGDRVVAAGCILPLSQNPRLSQSLGTRHRAALGLAEETDAVVVVVSEETGGISIAAEGKLVRRLDEGALRSELSRRFPSHPGGSED